MIIRNVIHKGLRRLMQDEDASGLPAAVVPKIVRILSFLQDMEREEELLSVPGWKAHRLSGDRKGCWSLHVTKNCRLTFAIDREGVEIIDLDYVDYH
ncbi:type II toxin-antitoxin system RelE/ParE family toxin [Niveispirillum sp.]|uniref:type II toxin-antitoxin system RelE/ParE family toxin n=1 Tax=Niveispirillum sp. TaxID=1917217 RepID=UPI001B75EEB0|nr:type II toxin-antitoxin system RelE/ParE family toxin [Niveispirillum sp.]MBP7338175.1 type II toxin-antitoxin system RelE/ParE family toxin [Niveispirillum sp.]